jgi:hypothetical protein
MAEPKNEQKRPCLHCMTVDEAIAKTMAELTSRQNGISAAPDRTLDWGTS